MARYESKVKTIKARPAAVYARLSDLNNLAVIKQRLDDPEAVEKIKEVGKIGDEQIEKARKYLQKLEFTADTLSADILPVGNMTIRITEREPDKCIKFESERSPIPLKFWIQILPVGEDESKIKLTLDASLNPFVRMMVDKPLTEGIDRAAEALATIPYDNLA